MICAIILAAGRSERMGRQKLLLPYAGSTVIAHIADQVLASPVDRVLVVVGRDATAIGDALAERSVVLVENPEERADMLSSVRCGLRALPETCEAVLVCLGDQPTITPELIDAMLRALGESPASVIVPSHGGRRGHPLLFAAEHIERVLTGYDEAGLRGLTRDAEVEALEVPAGEGVLCDMDHPEDYERELRRLEGVRP